MKIDDLIRDLERRQEEVVRLINIETTNIGNAQDHKRRLLAEQEENRITLARLRSLSDTRS